ncbi:BrnT family toxin [Brenneria corticis]|uniref:BrnT family toxin n=1 Tax=Brenneria corticis TaxID=2173106 RepID=A0A2U1U4W6_9GAMM|nr:BrnT family toxin [Brenneria sp. CFCC 11842]PWC16703.1 hypothetical protein DDT56_08135 [Brenneria sp. CFCC 11842]
MSFELATRVFADPYALFEQDRIENEEYRWQTLGLIENHIVLMVAHSIRDKEGGTEVIRIISVRKADAKERRRYEQNRALQG